MLVQKLHLLMLPKSMRFVLHSVLKNVHGCPAMLRPRIVESRFDAVAPVTEIFLARHLMLAMSLWINQVEIRK